jgi:hypothetical protein
MAFSAYRFRDQEAAIRRKQRGRMELHVLHVDATSPRAIRHGNSVAAGSRRVRRVQEHAAEPAARENCFLGQNRKNLSRGLIENISADACNRPINVRRLDRMMRSRQKVHRSGIRDHLDCRAGTDPFEECPLNRKSGLIFVMNNALQRMARLGGQVELFWMVRR